MILPKLLGRRLYLAPYDEAYSEDFARWLNDPEVFPNLLVATQAINLAGERRFMEQLGQGHNYLIVLREGDRVIGGVGLADLDAAHQNAELGIVIGAKDCWDQGCGPEAIALLARYGFDYLNLHSIRLRVYGFNERARRSYLKVGFREVGRYREAIRQRGAWHDLVLMDLLEPDLRAYEAAQGG